jgi:hypothetical protein
MPGLVSALDFSCCFRKIRQDVIGMGSSHSGLRDRPRMSTVRQFGKKMWPLFYAVLANGRNSARALQWAKNELHYITLI